MGRGWMPTVTNGHCGPNIEAMLPGSPIPNAEEYAIHDYEGFEGAAVSEYMGLTQVVTLAQFIREHGKLGAEIYDHFGGDLDEGEDAMTERHLGCYTSLADYMEEVTECSVSIPPSLQFYIDWQATARDGEQVESRKRVNARSMVVFVR